MPCGRKKHLPEFMATLTQGASRETQTAAGRCKINTSPSFQRVGLKPVKKKPQISADSQFRKKSKQNYKSSGCCRCCIGKLKKRTLWVVGMWIFVPLRTCWHSLATCSHNKFPLFPWYILKDVFETYGIDIIHLHPTSIEILGAFSLINHLAGLIIRNPGNINSLAHGPPARTWTCFPKWPGKPVDKNLQRKKVSISLQMRFYDMWMEAFWCIQQNTVKKKLLRGLYFISSYSLYKKMNPKSLADGFVSQK